MGQTNLYAGNLINKRIIAPSRFDRIFNIMLPKVYSDGDSIPSWGGSPVTMPGATVDISADLSAMQSAVTNYDTDDQGLSTIIVQETPAIVKELAYHLDTVYYTVTIG